MAYFFFIKRQIWDFAELSLLEYKSADLYCKVLKEQGFEVETGIAGIKTAFTGTYGSGKPVMKLRQSRSALSTPVSVRRTY